MSRVGIAAINGGYDRSRGFVITDNVFTGPAVWPRARGIEEINTLSVTGAGHVVAYNSFTGVGDGVHGTSHGRLSASDFHNNDFDLCTDDAIEADYSDTNIYASPAAAKASGALYRTHGAVVVRPQGNFASGLERPADFRVRYRATDTDLRLDKASRAVDGGVEVSNFSEGFTGKAPDLACCELGQPLPHYGPRPAAPR